MGSEDKVFMRIGKLSPNDQENEAVNQGITKQYFVFFLIYQDNLY